MRVNGPCLLAVCNHGDLSTTFRNTDHLETFTSQKIDNLLIHFVTAAPEERALTHMAQEIASKEWKEAEEPGSASSTAFVEGNPEDVDIHYEMEGFMTQKLKWTHRELHDTVVIAGMSAPATPSMMNYFAALHHQFGDVNIGFLPQNWQSHIKKRIQDVLRCMGRTGLKLGGKLADKKSVLAGRLAHWLNKILEAGRENPPQKDEHDIANIDGSDDENTAPQKLRSSK
jgi:hypothetical protein